MTRSKTYLSVLMAGLLAAAGVQAQTAEVPVSDKDLIRQGANGLSGAAVTSSVPPKAGEASTAVNGKPNADPAKPLVGKSRAEVRAEVTMSRAQWDAARAAQLMGGSAGSAAEGGTPK